MQCTLKHALNRVIVPRLKWSGRDIDSKLAFKVSQIIAVGYSDKQIDISLIKVTQLENIYTGNVTNHKSIRIKGGSTVTSVHFGPYDNNYLLLGLSNGYLLGFNPTTLEITLAD